MAKTLFQKMIDREIPAKIEFEDANYLVIHDIFAGSTRPCPGDSQENRLPRSATLTPADRETRRRHVHRRQPRSCPSWARPIFRTVFNCGEGAQQTIFHLHLPRPWPAATSPGRPARHNMFGVSVMHLQKKTTPAVSTVWSGGEKIAPLREALKLPRLAYRYRGLSQTLFSSGPLSQIYRSTGVHLFRD